MKYKSIPVLVDAEPYKEGLEDSWVEVHKADLHSMWYRRQTDSFFTVEIPVVVVNGEKLFVCKGDYVITDMSGNRSLCQKDMFELEYTPAE